MSDIASPAALDAAGVPSEISARVTFQDLFDAADSARIQHQSCADRALDHARASDQQSERDRAEWLALARRQQRLADIFKAQALLIARVSKARDIVARLGEIAKREAAEAAAREAEAKADAEEALR